MDYHSIRKTIPYSHIIHYHMLPPKDDVLKLANASASASAASACESPFISTTSISSNEVRLYGGILHCPNPILPVALADLGLQLGCADSFDSP
jgi:hypothetical protein